MQHAVFPSGDAEECSDQLPCSCLEFCKVNHNIGKAGRKRPGYPPNSSWFWVMNPNDHPHGGGGDWLTHGSMYTLGKHLGANLHLA